MDHADTMSRSIDVAVAAIRGADPARFDDPSPCSEYTVGQVVSHLAFGLLLAEYAALRKDWEEGWSGNDRAPYLVDVPEDQWADKAAAQGEATKRAWADPAAWDGETTFGGGAMPAAAVGSMMIAEFVVHGWDVAAATGERVEVGAPLGEAVLEGVNAIAPMGRDGGWFAPEVTVPADAPALDRALGAAGRDPAWTP
ncbi:TIGR03086 family metal-binding protein [Pseudonocardia lacus]|uniref:TIGR03086 family metal-binding protein n=1 Tax=Pseudonocardia lacus TaxID=2835865 RepID=UPI002028DBAA|nr:TIGR03086 family metal-binding protein [Pseudonocardia lacus]